MQSIISLRLIMLLDFLESRDNIWCRNGNSQVLYICIVTGTVYSTQKYYKQTSARLYLR